MDRDYVKKNMKQRFRMAWKAPGFKNDSFAPIHPLRPQVVEANL